jgi:hypothetical protein
VRAIANVSVQFDNIWHVFCIFILTAIKYCVKHSYIVEPCSYIVEPCTYIVEPCTYIVYFPTYYQDMCMCAKVKHNCVRSNIITKDITNRFAVVNMWSYIFRRITLLCDPTHLCSISTILPMYNKDALLTPYLGQLLEYFLRLLCLIFQKWC